MSDKQTREVLRAYREAHPELNQLDSWMTRAPAKFGSIHYGSLAYNILVKLDNVGKQSVADLGGGTKYGQSNVSAQILRLMDRDLIDRDSSGLLFITPTGREVVAALAEQHYGHVDDDDF